MIYQYTPQREQPGAGLAAIGEANRKLEDERRVREERSGQLKVPLFGPAFRAAAIRLRLAEAERREAETPKALREKLCEAEAQEAEARDESARREQARCDAANAVIDSAIPRLDKIEAYAAGLIEELAGFDADIGRLAAYVQQQHVLGDIRLLAWTRARGLLGREFGAPPLQGPHSRSFSETVTRDWLRRLAGIKDDAA